MAKKNQSSRLTEQHKLSKGVVGIFGDEAKLHDKTVSEIAQLVKQKLEQNYPNLVFRYRTSISKVEKKERIFPS